jgi:hypothetical protein
MPGPHQGLNQFYSRFMINHADQVSKLCGIPEEVLVGDQDKDTINMLKKIHAELVLARWERQARWMNEFHARCNNKF